MATPAEQLEGQSLLNGWKVGPILPKSASQTGGHFSCSYGASQTNGKNAFLKAMDYTAALSSSDPASALNRLTSAFLFERDVLQDCLDKKMSRVVRAIDGGKVTVNGNVVEYLIFEPAKGDIRVHLDSTSKFDLVWTLTCLHNICVGVQQLHGASIAHQDLKPSNVLHFETEGQKLADLGRSWHKTRVSPYDALLCAGDMGYAPPELLYRYSSPDELDRRFGADFYLAGSMIPFLFFGMRASAMLINGLDPAHRPNSWTGTYEDVLPYLRHSFSDNLQIIRKSFPDQKLSEEIVDLIGQMCDPDINTRGDRMHRAKYGSRFGLQRLISTFDRLRAAAILGRISHK